MQGYAGALASFYEESASRIAAHLDVGRNVVLLAEGDPLFYGSFMYMHDRLAERYATEIVPGIPAFVAATAIAASPLARQTDVLTVLPGTLPEPDMDVLRTRPDDVIEAARALSVSDGHLAKKEKELIASIQERLGLPKS
jgi:precorrin-2 C(20)-methyltransferase